MNAASGQSVIAQSGQEVSDGDRPKAPISGMKIGVDVDDVIRATNMHLFARYCLANPEFDKDFDSISDWDLRKFYENPDVLTLFFKDWAADVFLNAFVVPQSLETLRQLRADGHQIVFATHQYPGNEGYTLTWLQKHGFEYDGIFFGAEKSILGVDVLIDDRIENLESAQRRGILPICFDRPWNREWLGLRVLDWGDLANTIRLLENCKTQPDASIEDESTPGPVCPVLQMEPVDENAIQDAVAQEVEDSSLIFHPPPCDAQDHLTPPSDFDRETIIAGAILSQIFGGGHGWSETHPSR